MKHVQLHAIVQRRNGRTPNTKRQSQHRTMHARRATEFMTKNIFRLIDIVRDSWHCNLNEMEEEDASL